MWGTYHERRVRAVSDEETVSESSLPSSDNTMDDLEKWFGILKFSDARFSLEDLAGRQADSSYSRLDQRETSASAQSSSPSSSPSKRAKLQTTLTISPHSPPKWQLEAHSNKGHSDSPPPKPERGPTPSFASLVATARDPARDWTALRIDLIAVPAIEWAYALVGWTGTLFSYMYSYKVSLLIHQFGYRVDLL